MYGFIMLFFGHSKISPYGLYYLMLVILKNRKKENDSINDKLLHTAEREYYVLLNYYMRELYPGVDYGTEEVIFIFIFKNK